MWDGRLETTVRMIQKGMDHTLLRRRLISSNVANAETPRYKAVDVDFQRLLQEAQGVAPAVLTRTDARHMQPIFPPTSVPLRWKIAAEGEARADGNTVELEREMARLAENQIRFQALTEALNHMFALVKDAIVEGGRR